MGGLHEGHGQLIRRAAPTRSCSCECVRQPTPIRSYAEDFDRYPRALEADRVLAQGSGANALWAPTVDTVYPGGLNVSCAPVSASRPPVPSLWRIPSRSL